MACIWKKRLKRNFSKLQVGDKVIGYFSGKSKSFVSIGVIEKSLSQDPNKKEIAIRKICDLQSPMSLGRVRQIKPFDNKLSNNGKLNTTVIPLTLDEYNLLMSIIHGAFLDVYDDVDSDLNSVDMPIKEALKLRPAKQISNSTTWIRDSRISKAALKHANYICEFATKSDNHESFIANYTKKIMLKHTI
ncbi:MAG: EVE domain-containing protein [Paludibacteraceae bacterium]|nr:EVE domain-containing protein [Paludibacteraceae bacterium]HOJ65547.1 EVE domain-containing protein [Paludibacteraceae bacterium]HOL28859.1 EVE domain-containing protein [Paludibacteraceae bacterium]HON01562.1 EVE domain-containing protein [Paludibacteraceae bacterium]HPQ12166.1 EVE domain-containing protein [Paludibacteraceae bacterium]